jgi:hypothetical protein
LRELNAGIKYTLFAEIYMKHYCYLIIIINLFGCDNNPNIHDFFKKNNSAEIGGIIVSHSTSDVNYLSYTLKNHEEYANKHDYDYWFRSGIIDDGKFQNKYGKDYIFKNGIYWQKLIAVKQAMDEKNDKGQPRYEWILWVDADAFFTDPNQGIDDLLKRYLKEDDFLLIAKDPLSCVNAGVWILKNNDEGRAFINLVEESFPFYKNVRWPEQQAMQDIIYSYVTRRDIENKKVSPEETRDCNQNRIIKGVKVVPQRTINSFYTVAREDIAWQPGDFIAHLAGMPNKLGLARRITQCIKAQAPTMKGCEINGSWNP